MESKFGTPLTKKEQWQEHLKRIKDHKGTLSSYCIANDLTLRELAYWRKKLQGETSIKRVTKNKISKKATFIPVQVSPAAFPLQSKMPDPKWVAEFVFHLSNLGRNLS